MNRTAVLMGLLLATVSFNGALGAGPASLPGVLPVQSLVERVQSCRPGTYWCPGQISGCCPNGYACGSTHCIKPRVPRVSTPTVRTPARSTGTPSIRTHTPSGRTSTITTRAPSARTPTVRTPDTGVCPSLQGIAADMRGLLGC